MDKKKLSEIDNETRLVNKTHIDMKSKVILDRQRTQGLRPILKN